MKDFFVAVDVAELALPTQKIDDVRLVKFPIFGVALVVDVVILESRELLSEGEASVQLTSSLR